MAIANLGSTSVKGTNGGTTSSVDTTGATLLVATLAYYTVIAISDSKANTWTQLTAHTSGSANSVIYYCKNPTVGTGHTFTSAVSGNYSVLHVLYFSGTDTSAPFDVQNGAGGVGSPFQTGSVTPGSANEVIVAHGGMNSSTGPYTIDSGFTAPLQDIYTGGVNFGSLTGYLIQTSAAAVNPTFGGGGGSNNAGNIATFKAGAAGPLFIPQAFQLPRQAINRASTY
jgi:hypothetical protein